MKGVWRLILTSFPLNGILYGPYMQTWVMNLVEIHCYKIRVSREISSDHIIGDTFEILENN